MRYFLDRGTLFIRGRFRAAGTAIPGGIATISTILASTVDPGYPASSPPAKELELAAAAAGIWRDYAGFTTAVPVQELCVFQCDFLTCFILAGTFLKKIRKRRDGGIGIILCSSGGMSDTALQEAVRTAGDTGRAVIAELGKKETGLSLSSVIVACEGPEEYSAAAQGSPAGDRIRNILSFGIPEAVKRSGREGRGRPAFFIFSRFKGRHWVEWTPERCPYYPCHFEGQRCDYCYCPLYPCGDESLGQWTGSVNGARVWNCSGCRMIHEPAVADYLKKYPEATVAELVRVSKKSKR